MDRIDIYVGFDNQYEAEEKARDLEHFKIGDVAVIAIIGLDGKEKRFEVWHNREETE